MTAQLKLYLLALLLVGCTTPNAGYEPFNTPNNPDLGIVVDMNVYTSSDMTWINIIPDMSHPLFTYDLSIAPMPDLLPFVCKVVDADCTAEVNACIMNGCNTFVDPCCAGSACHRIATGSKFYSCRALPDMTLADDAGPDMITHAKAFGDFCSNDGECISGLCRMFQGGAVEKCTLPCVYVAQTTPAPECANPPSTGLCTNNGYCKF
jgi:hypothetical protein